MTGQARFGADAHDDLQGIGGFNIAQGESYATRQNLDDLLVGIVSFFRQQTAFTVVDGGSNNIGSFG